MTKCFGVMTQSAFFNKNLCKVRKLDMMESVWVTEQQQVKTNKLLADTQKTSWKNNFIDNLLIKCKHHGGPVTNKWSEISNISHDKAALRIEVQYQWLTHPTDALLRLELYKVYGLNTEKMSTNLICLVWSCPIPESKTADFLLKMMSWMLWRVELL